MHDPKIEQVDRLIQKLTFPTRCIVKHMVRGSHTVRELAQAFDTSQDRIRKVYGDGVRELARQMNERKWFT